IGTELFSDHSVYPKLFFKEPHLWKSFLENIENKIIKGINYVVIDNLNNNVLLSNWSRNNKSKLLTNRLNTERKTILTNIHTDYLKYFEENNYANYQKRIKDYEVININNVTSQIWLNTNKEKIKINFEVLSINARELTVKEVENLLISK